MVRFVLVLSALATPLTAQETVAAPYQVDGLQYGVTDVGPLVIVPLARAPGPVLQDGNWPMPDPERLARVTLLGSAGWTVGTLHSVERRCEFLCAYEGPQECHWVALIAPASDVAALGTVLAAIPGALQLEGYALRPDTGDPMARLDEGSAGPTVWESWTDEPVTWSVRAFPADHTAITLESRWGDGVQATVEGRACTSSTREWLLSVDCGSVSVLASGGRVLLVSQADYNRPTSEPVARFDHAGSRHYLVRFGAKAQDVLGLLSAEPEGWRARFHPRDWAQIC